MDCVLWSLKHPLNAQFILNMQFRDYEIVTSRLAFDFYEEFSVVTVVLCEFEHRYSMRLYINIKDDKNTKRVSVKVFGLLIKFN